MSSTGSSHPLLLVLSDTVEDRDWTLLKDEIVIGRGEECDYVIPNRQISRQHLRIFRDGQDYIVEDLESRNGTWVNEQQLKGQRLLQNGDVINLAMVAKLQFIGSDATAPMPFEVPASLTDGRLRIDRESRRVFVRGSEIDPPLSVPQYRLLELLFTNIGRICTRDQVVEFVWPDAIGEGVSEQAIDALVRRLRDRLAELDSEHQYIIPVRGHGFRLDNPLD